MCNSKNSQSSEKLNTSFFSLSDFVLKNTYKSWNKGVRDGHSDHYSAKYNEHSDNLNSRISDHIPLSLKSATAVEVDLGPKITPV